LNTCEVWSKSHTKAVNSNTQHKIFAVAYYLPPAAASHITQIEAQLKALQERPALSTDQDEYVKKLYDNRSNECHGSLTQEQNDYIKNLYDNRNDFKTPDSAAHGLAPAALKAGLSIG
jgi:hypothetical protein